MSTWTIRQALPVPAGRYPTTVSMMPPSILDMGTKQPQSPVAGSLGHYSILKCLSTTQSHHLHHQQFFSWFLSSVPPGCFSRAVAAEITVRIPFLMKHTETLPDNSSSHLKLLVDIHNPSHFNPQPPPPSSISTYEQGTSRSRPLNLMQSGLTMLPQTWQHPNSFVSHNETLPPGFSCTSFSNTSFSSGQKPFNCFSTTPSRFCLSAAHLNTLQLH